MATKKIKVDYIQETSISKFRVNHGDLTALTASIKKNGLFNPLRVRPLAKPSSGKPQQYGLISGARRLACIRKLGLLQVTVEILDINEKKSASIWYHDNGLTKSLRSPTWFGSPAISTRWV